VQTMEREQQLRVRSFEQLYREGYRGVVAFSLATAKLPKILPKQPSLRHTNTGDVSRITTILEHGCAG
jgi:hypothetical protein